MTRIEIKTISNGNVERSVEYVRVVAHLCALVAMCNCQVWTFAVVCAIWMKLIVHIGIVDFFLVLLNDVQCRLPFVRHGYYVNSSGFVHHLQFHVHRRISAQISCQNWCRPSSRPISMFADAAAGPMFAAWHMATVDWNDGLNHSHTMRYCHEHRLL